MNHKMSKESMKDAGRSEWGLEQNELGRLLDLTDSYQTEVKFDASNALSRFEKNHTAKTFSLKRFRSIAAIGVMLIAAVFALRMMVSSADFEQTLVEGNNILQDQSEVILAGNSTADTDFSKDRNVLLDGKAFFQVTKSTTPFIVKACDLQITVLGTAFEVDCSKKNPIVSVESGRVEVLNTLTAEKVIITKNEQIELIDSRLQKSIISSSNYFSWANNQLSFQDEKLSAVLADVEHHFEVKISLANSDLTDCKFTSTLPLSGNSLDEVLSFVSAPFDLEIKKNSNADYVLEGGFCK